MCFNVVLVFFGLVSVGFVALGDFVCLFFLEEQEFILFLFIYFFI